MDEDYAEVPLETPLAELGAKFLVEFGDDVALVDSRRTKNGRRRHLGIHFDGSAAKRMLDVPAKRTVGAVAATLSGLRPTRAFTLPPGRIVDSGEGDRNRAWHLLMIPGVVMMALGVNVPFVPVARFLILLIGVTAIVAGWQLGRRRHGARQWAFVSGQSTATLEQLRPAPALEMAVVPDVDAIKEEYGRLVSDIAYRIEHPALFDPHEPLTREFTLALMQWDNTHRALDAVEQEALGTRVTAGFRAARANAERIGMDHLPTESREQATTALKAARLATDEDAAPAERTAALGQAIRILDALALYYLPTGIDARDAIEGRPIRQLPGRRSSS